MSMDVGGGKGGVKAEINVTPLVDVMLVLLIIMMLVAPLVQQGAPINLPTAANTADKPESPDQAIVGISADRLMYVNGQPVAKGELGVKLTEALDGKKEQMVLMKADKTVNYGAVMDAMDELRDAGIENIALVTDPKPAEGGGAGGGR